MTELLPVVLVAMALAVYSHQQSDYSRSMECYRAKESLWYTVMSVVLILFVGLRTSYNDTYYYRHAYELLRVDGFILNGVTDWSLGANPGFTLVNSIFRHLGVSTQSFLMIYAAVTLGIYMWFLRKYTTNIWLTIFLFITMGCYTFTMAAIKQCVAVAFCLVAVDLMLQGRYKRSYLWVLLAATFHPYALMFLAVPYLMFHPWSQNTYVSLAIFGTVGILLQFFLGTIVDITTMMGEEFSVTSFSGEGVNPFRLIVCAVPVLLSWLARRHISHMDEKQERAFFLFTNLSILNAEIMFVALFGTANYFARLANYFLIFQALSIPWLFRFFDRESKKLLTRGAVAGYFLYFIYANAINQNFDAEHKGVTLLDYLLSLF